MMSLAPVEWQEGRLGRIGREILVARNLEQDVIFGVEMKGRQRYRRGDEDEGLERPPRAGLGPGHALDLGHQRVQQRAIARQLLDEAQQDRKSVVQGKSVSGRVELGGRRNIKKKK